VANFWKGKGARVESDDLHTLNRIASHLCYIQRIFWDQYMHLFNYFYSSTGLLVLKDSKKECL